MTAAAILVSLLAAPPAAAQVLASLEDAYITHNPEEQTWSIGNQGIQLTLGLIQRTGDLRILELRNPRTGRALNVAIAPDAALTIDGARVSLGTNQGSARLNEFHAEEMDDGVRLGFDFTLGPARARATRYYRVFPGSPVVEAWTVVEPQSGVATISDPVVWEFAMGPGRVHWVTGLRPAEGDAAGFTKKSRDLGPGERLTIGSLRRSSEEALPWFMLETEEQDRFFGGLMWSGAWSLTVERRDAEIKATIGLPGVSTDVRSGQPLELPHGYFGLASESDGDASAGLRAFFERGVRRGWPLDPLVIYNTWFTYGTAVDEASIVSEMRHQAGLGAEVFVLDAGWHAGANGDDISDFTTGIGAWTADPDRFPAGLGALAEEAGNLALRFGLWIEPERTALVHVNRPGLVKERWLATQDGRYDPDRSPSETRAAQICLADPDARQWVFDQTARVIEEAQLDYLKWDNNFWINCNRAGHGHGPEDGNLRHVQALYAVLGQLRARYPDLIVENVSGGGNRLDLGMMRFSEVGWMDDVSAPARHVRHNLEGLGSVLPPAYLLSFVMGGDGEPVNQDGDMPLYFRSRMPGVLGLSFLGAEMSEGDEEQIRQEIGVYKRMRDVLRRGSGVLLGPQVHDDDAPAWDVMEVVSASGEAVVFAFQNDPGASRTVVRPVQLRPEAIYEIHSADRGLIGVASGNQLLEQGIEIVASPNSAAHVLTLRLRPSEAPTQP